MIQDVKLRAADELECIRGGFPSGKAALDHSIRNSTVAYTVNSPDGDVLAYWGYRVLTVLGGGCVAWMLSTPEIERWPMFAARQSIKLLDFLLDTYGDVYVGVDETYTLSVEWLRWLGFEDFCPTDNPPFIQMRAIRKTTVN